MGISLVGTEVKSMRTGKFSFTDAYAKVTKADQLVLVGFHISPYPFGNLFNHDPDRNRILLAHKHEIKKLRRKVDEKGCTLIPLKFYLKAGKVKLSQGSPRGRSRRINDRPLNKEMKKGRWNGSSNKDFRTDRKNVG